MNGQKRAAVLRHIDGDHLARFATLLDDAGIRYEYFDMHRGAPLPRPEDFDLLVVMGAAIQAWQVAENPWLASEIAAIGHWAGTLKKPFLGICFGHQLLAAALGGSVGRSAQKEVGAFDVRFCGGGNRDRLLDGTGVDGFTALHWHHAEVTSLPEGASVLASSATTPVQAMAIGSHALSVQFHWEWTLSFIKEWADMPNWASALDDELGPGAHGRLMADARRIMPQINAVAVRMFGNFLAANALAPVRSVDVGTAS